MYSEQLYASQVLKFKSVHIDEIADITGVKNIYVYTKTYKNIYSHSVAISKDNREHDWI